MKSITLTKGYIALVDDADYKQLMIYTWSASENRKGGKVYATSNDKQYMHRIIMAAEKHQLVDHIDGDGLNNRRYNLRFLANYSNVQRAKIHYEPRAKTSQYRGVRKKLDGRVRPWQAMLASIHLGYFETEEEAARMYDSYAVKQYGELAFKNFP